MTTHWIKGEVIGTRSPDGKIIIGAMTAVGIYLTASATESGMRTGICGSRWR